MRGSRGFEGVEGSPAELGVEVEGSDGGSEEHSAEESEEEGCSREGGCSMGEEGGIGEFALGLGRRENIGKEDEEEFMHLAERN